MPSARVRVIAGMPSGVAGILTIRLGRSTVFHRSGASATVASVSWAMPRVDLDGDPAVDAAGALPHLAEHVAGVADVRGGDLADRVLDRGAPRGERVELLVVVVARPRSALAKIVGLLVTPTTSESLISAARLPDSMRWRDRSSSQMETPAAERSARGVLLAMGVSFAKRGPGQAEDSLARASERRPASTTCSVVNPNCWNRVL